MKYTKLLVLLPVLFLTFTVFCFEEGFDLGSSEETDYYANDYYGNEIVMARKSPDFEPSYKFNYDGYARSRYLGRGKVFIFDPKLLRWYAYYNGELINSGRASGGRHYCADVRRPCRTPIGVFSITSKGGPGCKSSKYPIGRGNAPMPWCMFFHRGFAIHGSWDVPNYNASHGCIRVQPAAARWLNANFLNHGTKVIVRSYR